MDEAELDRLLWQYGEEAWYEGKTTDPSALEAWKRKRRETVQKIDAEVARLKKWEK